MKKFAKDCSASAHRAVQQCRCAIRTAASAGKRFRSIAFIAAAFLLAAFAATGDLPEDKLNIVFYRFLEESDDVYMEIIPGDRFRLPLIRGYQVRVDIDKIEINALTRGEVIEPDGMIMPSGHIAQGYNLGRLSTLEYELIIHFDHQTDRYFISMRDDSIRVSPFRDEFTAVVVP